MSSGTNFTINTNTFVETDDVSMAFAQRMPPCWQKQCANLDLILSSAEVGLGDYNTSIPSADGRFLRDAS